MRATATVTARAGATCWSRPTSPTTVARCPVSSRPPALQRRSGPARPLVRPAPAGARRCLAASLARWLPPPSRPARVRRGAAPPHRRGWRRGCRPTVAPPGGFAGTPAARPFRPAAIVPGPPGRRLVPACRLLRRAGPPPRSCSGGAVPAAVPALHGRPAAAPPPGSRPSAALLFRLACRSGAVLLLPVPVGPSPARPAAAVCLTWSAAPLSRRGAGSAVVRVASFGRDVTISSAWSLR